MKLPVETWFGAHSPEEGKALASALRMPKTVIFYGLVCSLLIGLQVVDKTGIARSTSIFNINNLWRLVIFGILGVSVVRSSFLLRPQNGFKISLSWLGIYILAIISVFANQKYEWSADEYKVIYGIVEWMIFLLMAGHLLSGPNVRSFDQAILVVRGFAIYLSGFLVMIVLAMSVIRPDLAFFPEPGWTLGGFLIHPNKLSVMCAVGIAALMAETRGNFRHVAVIFLLGITVLTGSRSGTLLGLLAIVHGSIGFVKGRARIFMYMFLLIMFAALLLYMFDASGPVRIGANSRDLSDLNGRDAVWRAAQYMIDRHPWLGWGWYEGPAQIGDYTGQGWWYARNAQNDVLNIAVASGVIAGSVAFFAYLRLVIVGIACEIAGSERFFFAAAIILISAGLVEPVVSDLANVVGLMVFLLATASLKRHRSMKKEQSQRYLAASRPGWIQPTPPAAVNRRGLFLGFRV